MEWNSSELRAGIDKWPETQAVVKDISQPYSNPKYALLSVVTYTFIDNSGEYWEGKYETRTQDLPPELTEGNSICVRYDPKNPRKRWCKDDYWRTGFGRFRAYDYPVTMLVVLVIFLVSIGLIELFHLQMHR